MWQWLGLHSMTITPISFLLSGIIIGHVFTEVISAANSFVYTLFLKAKWLLHIS